MFMDKFFPDLIEQKHIGYILLFVVPTRLTESRDHVEHSQSALMLTASQSLKCLAHVKQWLA